MTMTMRDLEPLATQMEAEVDLLDARIARLTRLVRRYGNANRGMELRMAQSDRRTTVQALARVRALQRLLVNEEGVPGSGVTQPHPMQREDN